MKVIFFLILTFSLSSSSELQNCTYKTPDMVSQLLPNYTGNIQPCSYAGFAPLDPNNESAIFYWYFPKENTNYPTNELIVWLGGGPGCASISDIMSENGPFTLIPLPEGGVNVSYIDQDNPVSWQYNYNVMWLDNPVGAGYSYTTNNEYPTNEDEIGRGVWTALQFFLSLHPETTSFNWYIGGESYAGRFVPASAYRILQNNENLKASEVSINLKGIVVEDGFIDGISQRVSMVEAAQMAGFYSPAQLKQAQTLSIECQNAWTNGNPQAYAICNQLFEYPLALTGIDLMLIDPLPYVSLISGNYVGPYMNNESVIRALNAENSKRPAPNTYIPCSSQAYDALEGDIMNSSIVYVNYLLPRVQCLFWGGTFDARDGAYSAYWWFPFLNDPYPNIMSEQRLLWYQQEEVAGYWTNYENLTFFDVLFAGHIAATYKLNVTTMVLQAFFNGNTEQFIFKNSSVTDMMCNAMNNCNNNGECGANGVCQCNEEFGLADCSIQAEDLMQGETFTLGPRQYGFFSIPANGNDQFVTFDNENGELMVLYSSTATGPVASLLEAEVSLLPQANVEGSRSLFLAASGRTFGYLTVQNTNYYESITVSVTLYTQTAEGYVANLGEISLVIGMYVVMILILVVIGALFWCHKKHMFDDQEPNTLLGNDLNLQASEHDIMYNS